MEIIIPIKNKIAYSPAEKIVCGNKDYKIVFVFDREWDQYRAKTARFVFANKTVDVVFDGDTCPCPMISDALVVAVGVFAGDLCTTTPALIGCQKSILCEEGVPTEPTEDVYNQIMLLFNSGFAPKVSSAEIGQTVVVKAVDENNIPTEWEAVDWCISDEEIAALEEEIN